MSMRCFDSFFFVQKKKPDNGFVLIRRENSHNAIPKDCRHLSKMGKAFTGIIQLNNFIRKQYSLIQEEN
jgi:hypothetical protein